MKSQNVGIATWYGPANYGTGLQALALKRYLEENGYKVFFIEDCRNQNNKKTNSYVRGMSKIKQIFNGQWQARKKYQIEIKEKELMQRSFVNQYNDEIFYIKSDEDIASLNNMADIFISGSDQIWNPYVYNPVNMLSVINDDKKKISFGTSVGVKDIPESYHEEYRNLLNRYNYISVRERQSKEALEKIISKEITELIDPTLLLNSDEWNFLTDNAEVNFELLKEKYIFCYFVGTRKSYWQYVKKIQKSTGYKVIVLPINNEGYVNKFQKFVKASPKEFLWMIKNAEIVCTDSFHATLFSIQYKKEFYTLKRFADINNNSQNGRLTDLLGKLNLSERLIDDEKKFDRKKICNYETLIMNLDKERKKAKKWLMNAIKS